MSLNFFVILAILAIGNATRAPEPRLVGGTPTTIQEFPFIVSLVYYYPGPQIWIQRCVGSLVSSFHVLTTGYCFTQAVIANMLVRAGSTYSMSGGTLRSIRDVIKHPEYVEAPRAGDIAIAVLDSPLGITDTIGVLYIPPQDTFIPDGYELKIVSWGFESETGPQLDTLQTVNMNKLPLDECQAIFSGSNAVTIGDPVICAAAPGRSVCVGDSGAPMVIGETLVGLSSYYDGCGDDKPDVFARIDRYTNWIIEVAASRVGDVDSVPYVRVAEQGSY
ncbi:trypsin delta-like isoform X2 [Plodia interpunctella]|uniref:trypsin delta-like isoform X2 n=1 Tax=Plodia interpunctella TaxID=58824 RepID=UPI002367737B|nr:trypsin delta-like isoform X2 [Plodia interpunctella]